MRAVLLFLMAILWAALYIVARNGSFRHRNSTTQHPLLSLLRKPMLAEVIGASGLLALATAGFFWQVLLTSDSWMPAGGGDLAPFLYPNYRFAADYLRQGILPLWNPHLYNGTPFAADIQSGLFYPINLLVFLLVPKLTFEWLEYLAIFHFWLAGATMYLCLRLLTPASNIGMQQLIHPNNVTSETGVSKLRSQSNGPPSNQRPHSPLMVSPVAAFAGAVAFEFSDLFIVHFGNLNMIAVAAWLPLIFLLYHRSLVHVSLGLAAASGAVLAIATLAGHIQITLFILLTLSLYTLWHLRFWILDFGSWIVGKVNNPDEAQQRLSSGLHLSRSRPIFLFLLMLLITIGLSALLLFPAYEMSQYTPRAELPYAEAARFSLHPAQLIGLLVPNYFGRDPALHWGPWERVETGYIGVITLILALIGALLYRGQMKGYFVGLGIITLLLAIGGYSILHGWLFATVPGFDQLRAPARFILLLDFSLATLAAFGLDRLLQPIDGQARATLSTLLKTVTWGLGGLIVVAVPLSYYAMLVTQDRNPAIFNRAIGAASAVATFALFTSAALIILHLRHKGWLRKNWTGTAIVILIGIDLFTLGQNVDVGHTNPASGFEHPDALAFLENDPNVFRLEVTTDIWHLWQPNTAMLNGQYDAWGLYNPLTLADTTLYWSSAPPRSSGRYNFLGIKYIIASKAGAPADGNIVPVFDADPQINVYLNQNTLAPVQFVGQTIMVTDHDAAWEAIHADTFDPTTQVILEEGQELDTQPSSSLAIMQYDLHTVTIGVETNHPGYVVMPDAFYPGWKATVDGRSEPIRRANFAFRAVYVPPGQHTVQFIFDPLIWKVGLGISAITLLVLLGWAGWQWRNTARNEIK